MNKPPINGTVPPHQGQPLPRDWKTQAPRRASDANAAYLERLQNAWKGTASPASSSPPIQRARLRSDAADHPYNGLQRTPNGAQKPQVRTDGELKLLFEDANGWQCWADQHGTKVWKRLDWDELIGRR